MENKFLTLSKRDLKDAMLIRMGELANLRADSRSLRSRMESTRSELAHVQFEIEQIQAALRAASIIQFPKQSCPSTPAIEEQAVKFSREQCKQA